jgi:hypothetical protein
MDYHEKSKGQETRPLKMFGLTFNDLQKSKHKDVKDLVIDSVKKGVLNRIMELKVTMHDQSGNGIYFESPIKNFGFGIKDAMVNFINDNIWDKIVAYSIKNDSDDFDRLVCIVSDWLVNDFNEIIEGSERIDNGY